MSSDKWDKALDVGDIDGAIVVDGGILSGYVVDRADPARELVVELFVDGWPISTARADRYDAHLSTSQPDDPFHGFTFRLSGLVAASTASVSVRVANSEIFVGDVLELTGLRSEDLVSKSGAFVDWIGGLRFAGWLSVRQDGAPRVRCLVEENLVAETAALGWTMTHHGPEGRAARAFDLHLPERFADGRLHRVTFLDDEGSAIQGSPLTFIAFRDGLAAFLGDKAEIESERPRGRLFERLFPQSFPFAWLDEWMARFPATSGSTALASPVAVVLLGEADLDDSLASLRACGDLWTLATMPLRSDDIHFDPKDLLTFLEALVDGFEHVVFARSGSIFDPSALSRLSTALSYGSKPVAVYADVILVGDHDERLPLALPSFDYERMLEQGLGAQLFSLRRVDAIKAASQGADNAYRLFNAVLDRQPSRERLPIHLPFFLACTPARTRREEGEALAAATRAHLAARSISAEVVMSPPGRWLPAAAVRRASEAARVTFIVAVNDRLDPLEPTIDAMLALKTRHFVDAIVVHGTAADTTTQYPHDSMTGRQTKVVHLTGTFNKARALNMGAAATSNPFLGFVEAGTILDRDWLDELIARCADPSVAAASGLLKSTSGIVCSAGLVLSPHVGAEDALRGCGDGDLGYADLSAVARSCSAVSATAFLTKRDAFLSVGGLDERFSRWFHVVDYCLKLAERHQGIVFSPHAQAFRQDNVLEFDEKNGRSKKQAYERELDALRMRWRDVLIADPFYSPLLALDGTPYSALAWPPRSE